MEYFNNILCIQANWLIEEGIITDYTYRNLTNRKQIEVVRRGCLNTPALVAFESIPSRFKEAIKIKVGDPYAIATKSTLASTIVRNAEAYKFFADYTLENGDHLPQDVQAEYTINAEILDAIHHLVTERKPKAKAIGGKSSQIWIKLAEAIQTLDKTAFKHTLPTNDRRLNDRYRRYMADGYETLIHGNWCNKNSEKINDAAKIWMLSRWTSMVNRIANESQLLAEYNLMAEAQGWKPLKSENAVHLFLYSEEIKGLWWAARYGELKYKEKFIYQHKTILPTMRDSLWYSDGTKLNYFYGYRDEKNRYKVGTTSVYEVMDVYSECLLGYYISDTEDYIAQYNAYRMALQTSGQKPYQITYDNQGGHKKLENGNFLTKLSHLSIPTKPYNGKSKTIESAFGRFQSQILKRDWFFTGQNIQAKREESKANMEFVTANRHNLPTKEEIAKVYKQRRAEWNAAPHPSTGIARIEMYNTSKNERAVKLEIMDMVELFWITREKPIQATAYGISFIEKGERHDYIVNGADGSPDVRWIAQNIDRKFRIKYDPTDYSLIYLYEDTPQGLRFITGAEEKHAIHRGKQEQEEGEMEWYARVEKASEELRLENDAYMRNIQEQWHQLPEQNGLVSPKLKGINSKKQEARSKKPQQTDNFGKLQKAISNAVAATSDDDDFNETDLYSLM